MEKIGETLKEIRLSIAMTQKDISKGIMSQSNYSKMEKNEIDVPFSKMIALLNRLNMSVDEFTYIHRGYNKDAPNHSNPMSKIQTGDTEKVLKKIEELTTKDNLSTREQELLTILEAVLMVSENDYDGAQKKGSIIWERLKEHDTWYLYDIELINSILYVFPAEIAESIVDIAVNRLEAYKNLRSVYPSIANLRLNLILLQINNQQYESALVNVEELMAFCMKRNYHTRLAVCYARKGIILEHLNRGEPSKWYEKGIRFLEFTNNTRLIEELQNEIDYATRKDK